MKSLSKARPYFKGYSLKAVTGQSKDINIEPYLEALIAGQSREASRAKILMMTRSAPEIKPAPPVHHSHVIISAEPSGNDWFRNYE